MQHTHTHRRAKEALTNPLNGPGDPLGSPETQNGLKPDSLSRAGKNVCPYKSFIRYAPLCANNNAQWIRWNGFYIYFVLLWETL